MAEPAVPQPLVCPACGTPHPGHERFCGQCGMPLTYADRQDPDAPVSAAHARARKIKPQYSEGDLVRVAGARNQAEAELIQGLLLGLCAVVALVALIAWIGTDVIAS